MLTPHISIVIVNYNVKEYVASLLISIGKASAGLITDIFVVDNASTDGSQEFLTSRFPTITFIRNDENVGFASANNQAIRKAKGTYTLIINPDTLIQENTLSTLLAHMQSNPNSAAAGCKLLNPDGSFAPESKRSIPTPLTALYKVLGFSASYYMSSLGENESGPVPVLSGAFMFCRTDVLQALGGFDERFFMYGEDIDLCYRILLAGYDIDYVPTTSIIHYKGESTKKDNLDYVILFNKAMYQFFEKHYSTRYTIWIKFVVRIGIVLRAVGSYLLTVVKRLSWPLSDLAVLNSVLALLFMARYGISVSDMPDAYQPGFLLLHSLASILFLALAKYGDIHGAKKWSVAALVKTMALTFAILAFITFFLRDYAFSRWILLLGFLYSSLLLSILRLARSYRGSSQNHTRILLIGVGSQTAHLIRSLRSKVDLNVELVGLLIQKDSPWTDTFEDVPIIGRPEHAPDLIRFHRIDQILFSGNAISTGDMLAVMSQIRDPLVTVKLVPESMDFIIGKSNVEYLDDIALVDLDIPYRRPWNRFLKRNLDVVLSVILLMLTSLPGLIALLMAHWRGTMLTRVRLYAEETHPTHILLFVALRDHRWTNRFLMVWYIFTGKLSFVGAPLVADRHPMPVYYKPGLTGMRQLNEARLNTEVERENYERFYVQNHSLWLDVRLMMQALWQRRIHDQDL
jgi:GT2 family glycosyltransferase/lipopolysaccharide/colanic/teichoic acid biosynthesis glycosyltransferase